METNGLVTRRRALGGAALGGLALALPIRGAWAQDTAEPAPDDVAAFLESIELAAVELYAAASATGRLTTPAVVQAANGYAGHHREHAASIARVAGAKATGRANPNLVPVIRGQLGNARDEKTVARILFDLENGLAGAYVAALEAFKDPKAAVAAAAVLPVESQHAVVLGTFVGLDLEAFVLPDYETRDRGLSSEQFPVTEKQQEPSS